MASIYLGTMSFPITTEVMNFLLYCTSGKLRGEKAKNVSSKEHRCWQHRPEDTARGRVGIADEIREIFFEENGKYTGNPTTQ